MELCLRESWWDGFRDQSVFPSGGLPRRMWLSGRESRIDPWRSASWLCNYILKHHGLVLSKSNHYFKEELHKMFVLPKYLVLWKKAKLCMHINCVAKYLFLFTILNENLNVWVLLYVNLLLSFYKHSQNSNSTLFFKCNHLYLYFIGISK